MRLAALTLLALSLGTGRARADEASATPHIEAPASYFPDVLADHQARDAARAREVERALELLPGVERARVTWHHTHPAWVPLDQPLPADKVTVALRTTGAGPRAEDLSRLLEGLGAPEATRPTIERIDLPILVQPPEAPPTRFGTGESPFRTLLALSLAANVLLATVLLLRARARG